MTPSSADAAGILVALRDVPLDAAEATTFVADPTCGGTAVFVGSVRPDDTTDGAVVALEYEAFDGAAERVMTRLAHEAMQRFGARRVAVLHRVGRVLPGEPAVVVAVACPHRAEAFDACRAVIDDLKRQVPIWKKEWTPSGGRWVGGAGTPVDPHGTPAHGRVGV